MDLGVMLSIRDFQSLSFPGSSFSELLLFEGDLEKVDSGLMSGLSRANPRIAFVHAQEFIRYGGGRRLLDLSSEDEDFRIASTKVVEETRALADAIGKVAVVIHPGGIRESAVDHEALFVNLEKSLSELGPCRLLLENMPWYYWQKGHGRMLSNVCVTMSDLERISEMVDGVVLDTSHGYLSREEGDQRYLFRFIDLLGGRVKHIHLSDARAPDKEGLQIGDGDIDFSFLKGTHLPVMIEVWKGHENGGSGFREGIRRVRELELGWSSSSRAGRKPQ